MEFNSAEFLGLSNRERVAKCRAFADEAECLARAASGETREGYFALSRSWTDLADEMESLDGDHIDQVRHNATG